MMAIGNCAGVNSTCSRISFCIPLVSLQLPFLCLFLHFVGSFTVLMFLLCLHVPPVSLQLLLLHLFSHFTGSYAVCFSFVSLELLLSSAISFLSSTLPLLLLIWGSNCCCRLIALKIMLSPFGLSLYAVLLLLIIRTQTELFVFVEQLF